MKPVTKCGALTSKGPCVFRAGHGGDCGAVLRGFAAMDPQKRKAICSAGGRAAQAKPGARRWTSEEARIAGKLGGIASQRKVVT